MISPNRNKQTNLISQDVLEIGIQESFNIESKNDSSPIWEKAVQSIKDIQLNKKKSARNFVNPFKDFTSNNWIKPGVTNDVLNETKGQNAAMHMSISGDFMYRPKEGEDFSKLDTLKATRTLENLLGHDIDLTSKKADVRPFDLLAVQNKFDPLETKEFYQIEDRWFRSSFVPTKYRVCKTPNKHPKIILKLILHLSGNDEKKFDWFINWIAYFFQTLEKSTVSLVLKGDQGTGKGIFFTEILSPLFGEKCCITVDDDRLGSNFKNWLIEKLFYNLNEISHDIKGRKSIKNFLKQLTTDRLIQAEIKYESSCGVEIFGNVLVTSNELAPLEIEPSDRRYTVFQAGWSLKKTDDMSDTFQLVKDIKEELSDFAAFLSQYRINQEQYNSPLDTPEKKILTENTTDRFSFFVARLKDQDLEYFINELSLNSGINLVRKTTEQELKKIFENRYITVSQISILFKSINDNEDISNKKLMMRMRSVDPELFKNLSGKKGSETYKSDGDFHYFI